jgi:hypothetical protein
MESRRQLRWRLELDQVITAAVGGAHSVLEYRHDRDVQCAHGLPPAQKQVPFTKPSGARGYLDRYYPEYRLVIELDGKQYHPGERRGDDQARDNANAVTSSTLRYGWDDVVRRSCETARQVGEALRRRGWADTLKPCSPTCRAVGVQSRPSRPAGTALAEDRVEDQWRVGQAGEHRVRAGRGQVGGRVRAGGDADGPGPRR